MKKQSAKARGTAWIDFGQPDRIPVRIGSAGWLNLSYPVILVIPYLCE